jgi:hypothetical protein
MRKMLATGETMKVVPGDILYVPRKPLANAREFVGLVTGTVSPVIGLQQQVMSLYTQAYNVWYTKESYRRQFSNLTNNQTFDSTTLLQLLRNLSAIPVTGVPTAK